MGRANVEGDVFLWFYAIWGRWSRGSGCEGRLPIIRLLPESIAIKGRQRYFFRPRKRRYPYRRFKEGGHARRRRNGKRNVRDFLRELSSDQGSKVHTSEVTHFL